MIQSFLTGFFLGLSLIFAIGAQNIFVLKQGIVGKHVFYVALFCALSDALLIIIGIVGISFFLHNFISQISKILFGFAALWLLGYGLLSLKSAFKSNKIGEIVTPVSKGLWPTLSLAAILTFLNPHVYLDTMILIGSIGQQYSENYKIAFTFGACLASFIFFFGLAYGARLILPLMQRTYSWKILDGLIALIMFTISFKLASSGNWL